MSNDTPVASQSTASDAECQRLVNSPFCPQVDPMKKSRTQRCAKALRDFYDRNLGLVLVLLAQTCGSVMNMATKLLSTGYAEKFHPVQIIFVRMFVTTVLGSLYMWYKQIPDFPLGPRDVRGLLVLRGMAGFTGLFGLYYSLSYLAISDATVITFIVPTATAFVCFIWLKEIFTWKEGAAGFIAFVGVLFVARPTFLFHSGPNDEASATTVFSKFPALEYSDGGVANPSAPVSATERSLAVILAVMGAFSASIAYATIRKIGKRAHSMLSINYFAVTATAGSALIMLLRPDIRFQLPHTVMQWILICIIGFAGFLLQFLLTEGLQRERAGRATNVIYLQLVFAFIIDRAVWGTTPPVESFVGGALIIGAAIWISLQKHSVPAEHKKARVVDEESSLLRSRAEDDS